MVRVYARRLACAVWRALSKVGEVVNVSDLQSRGPAPERIPATKLVSVQYTQYPRDVENRNRLDAVRIMLPPLRGFPRASFVCFMTADACFTARKQLARIN